MSSQRKPGESLIEYELRVRAEHQSTANQEQQRIAALERPLLIHALEEAALQVERVMADVVGEAKRMPGYGAARMIEGSRPGETYTVSLQTWPRTRPDTSRDPDTDNFSYMLSGNGTALIAFGIRKGSGKPLPFDVPIIQATQPRIDEEGLTQAILKAAGL